MPTVFQIGKKGGGKTLRAMMQIEQELKNTQRSIVTNFPIRYERFRQYMVDKYGSDFGYKDRLLIIDTFQTAQFWLYFGVQEVLYTPFDELTPQVQKIERARAEKEWAFLTKKGPVEWASSAEDLLEGKYKFVPRKVTGRVHVFDSNGSEDEESVKKKDRKVYVPDFSAREGFPSVAYFLDEIHLTFNSRKWTRTGEDCLYYISLERHFGDDQWLCTQCFGNVDKQMRDMGQEYIVCTNQRKTPLAGTFGLARRPGDFTATHYSDPPTGKEAEAIQVEGFPLDVQGIASCYTTVTASQFGLTDDADKNVKRAGKIPFSIVVLIVVFGFAGLIAGGAKAAEWVIQRGANKVGAKTQSVYGVESVAETNRSRPDLRPSLQVRSRPEVASVASQVELQPLYVTGFAYELRSKGVAVYLSDGRTVRPGEYIVCGRDSILFESRRITFKPAGEQVQVIPWAR